MRKTCQTRPFDKETPSLTFLTKEGTRLVFRQSIRHKECEAACEDSSFRMTSLRIRYL